MPIVLTPPAEITYVGPATLAYQLDCENCFWQRHRGRQRPASPMPGLLPKLDSIQKRRLHGTALPALDPRLPRGTITPGRRVTSMPVVAPGSSTAVAIRGVIDAGLDLSIGVGGALDFKTAVRTREKDERYGRQMNGYGFAIQNPAAGQAEECGLLGLVYFSPSLTSSPVGTSHHVEFTPKVVVLPYDEAASIALLERVSALLDGPEPAPGRSCEWCAYLTELASQGTR